jgi:hypothetical protein
MSSKSRKAQSHQEKVFRVVEGSPKLLDLLENATSTPKKAIFIGSLLEILPSAFDTSGDHDPFANFTLTYGAFPNSKTRFPGTAAAIQHRQENIEDNRFKKREFISDIGLDWTAKDTTKFLSKVNSPCQCYLEVLISLIG